MKSYEKYGYLKNDFEIFYLNNSLTIEPQHHYHDFFKVFIFLEGNISYFVEGKTYHLNPMDIILISPGEIHTPILNDNKGYERLIFYISHSFFENYKKEGYNLSECFFKTNDYSTNLIIPDASTNNRLLQNINDLKNTFITQEYASTLYREIMFMEFIINLNRSVLKNDITYQNATTSNKKVLSIIEYINQNLTNDITIDKISNDFFLNRSYLMHLFKKETGHTLGNYIAEKRLFAAKKMISEGTPLTEACFKSGFKNYVSFYRAYKSKYKLSPKDSKKSDTF